MMMMIDLHPVHYLILMILLLKLENLPYPSQLQYETYVQLMRPKAVTKSIFQKKRRDLLLLSLLRTHLVQINTHMRRIKINKNTH